MQNNGYDPSNSDWQQENYQPQYTRGQKLAATGLAVFALLTIVIWSVQFKNTFFNTDKQNAIKTTDQTTGQDQLSQDDTVKKTQDTDGDGLNDWDETNIYNTSPYIADSDSDGISDGQEVRAATDPNCPQGRSCYRAPDNSATSSAVDLTNPNANENQPIDGGQINLDNGLNQQISNMNKLLDPSGSSSGGSIPPNASGSSLDIQGIMAGNGDAKTLRKVLLDSGMNKEILDSISDQQLMQAYKETLNNQ